MSSGAITPKAFGQFQYPTSPLHLWPDSEERTRAAVDKAYADRSAESQPQVDEAA
ncbi:hypothetical protein [Streptomyces sp. NBC_01014]|uniref:hypothetical protein n=1 Tax=Streptomyces sp. NBC_01014 TaxID=2903719 RepID=UPI003869BAC5|nr:hypothetical protein OG282_10600 [Streptomyces sp. NBC_01014]